MLSLESVGLSKERKANSQEQIVFGTPIFPGTVLKNVEIRVYFKMP